MFGFLFHKKRDEVRRVLMGRMNRRFLRQFRMGDRSDPRGSFCEVVFVIPCDEDGGDPRFDSAFPVVTKEISAEGLSFIYNEPVLCERLLIGFEGKLEQIFIAFEVQHSSPLGYGFYHIGLHPQELIDVSPSSIRELEKRIEQLEQTSEAVCC